MGVINTTEHIVTVALEQNDVLPSSPQSLGCSQHFQADPLPFQVLFRAATLF